MRAIQIDKFGGPEVLQYRTDVPIPSIKDDEVSNVNLLNFSQAILAIIAQSYWFIVVIYTMFSKLPAEQQEM